MKKRNMTPTIYAPTLVDSAGSRHIIPRKNAFALCGVSIGDQYSPGEHRINTLCLRCRQKYMREVLGTGVQEFKL